MKGIVVEIKNNEAAVLSDDGAVSRVKNKNYEIGQVIMMKQIKNLKSKMFASVASFAAAIALFAVGTFAYYTPTSYVSLDVNPSIEYSVNMVDRVLDVKAVNDDGKEIVYSLDVKNQKISDAIKDTVDMLIKDGFITKDENAGVILSVENSDADKADKLAKDLEEKTQKHIDEMSETAKVEAEAVGKARVEEARKLGVTPGKLNLVQKLQASINDSTKTDNEAWLKAHLEMSVKDINKAIKANREQLKEAAKDVDADKDTDVDSDDDNDKVVNENKPVKNNNASKAPNENKPVKIEKDNEVQDDEDQAVTVIDEDDQDDVDADKVLDSNQEVKSNNGNSDNNKDEKSNNGKSENSKN